MSKYRFLLLRRITQVGLLFLFFAGNAYKWHVLRGTLSFSKLFNKVPLADPFVVLQTLAAGAALGVDILVGALLITLFYGVLAGRAFCGWVCPVNMVTDLANWSRRKLLLDKAVSKVRLSRDVRYWVLALSLVVSALTGLAAFELVSPVTIFNRGVIFGLGMSGVVVALIFLFDLFGVKNGWCGRICPLGGFYALLGCFSLIRVRHNPANCSLCMKCRDICPEMEVLRIIGKERTSVNMGECINCGRCIEVCENEALKFGIRDLSQKIKGVGDEKNYYDGIFSNIGD